MIRIELTRRQHRELRKYFDAVRMAFIHDRRGLLAAQVHEDWGGESAYLRVAFLPESAAKKAIEGMHEGYQTIPYARGGIPTDYDRREWVRFPESSARAVGEQR